MEAHTAAVTLTTHAAGLSLRYLLFKERVDGIVFYTVLAEATSPGGETEREVIAQLTSDRSLALRVLVALWRGAVTPCAARGVADDLIALSVW